MNISRYSVFLYAAMALFLGSASTLAQAQIQTVAKTGDQAPGTPTGVTFSTFLVPRITSDGVLTFKANLQGDGVTADNNQGYWVGPRGALQLLVRKGDAAPGTLPGVNFGTLDNAQWANEAGDSAFRSLLTGSGITADNDHGIWVGSPGSLQLVARAGDPAPGTPPGVNFQFIFGPKLSATGVVGFVARTSANNIGIWVGAPGDLQLVAREGDAAPGTPAGVTYGSIQHNTLNFNGNGEVIFNSSLTGDAIGDIGIWTGLPGNLKLVVRGGDPAPGTPAGVNFTTPRSLVFNDNGEVSLASFLSDGTGVPLANNKGIWTGPPGNLQLLIRQGDLAPGTLGGETLELPGGGVAFLNTNGLVTLHPGVRLTGSGVTPDNDQGIWVGPPGGLELIAREGDPAPGTTGVFVNPRQYAMNAQDKLMFVSDLGGSAISGTQRGLWLWSQGGTDLLVRDGDIVEIAPGDLRGIFNPGINTNGSPGNLDGFSDAGHIAFRAAIPQFGQGVFVIAPSNSPPVAVVTTLGVVDIGATPRVRLDGTGSFDPDNVSPALPTDGLTFRWFVDGSSIPEPVCAGGADNGDVDVCGIVSIPVSYGVETVITLEVKDPDGSVGTFDVTVTVDPALLSILDIDKAKVEFAKDKVKVRGSVGLPLGVHFSEVSPELLVTLTVAGIDIVDQVPVILTLEDGGREWKFKDKGASAGLTKVNVDWKGSRYRFKDKGYPLRFKSEVITTSESLLKVKLKAGNIATDFTMTIATPFFAPATVEFGADSRVLSADVVFDEEEPGEEVVLTLPFPLTDDSTITVTSTNNSLDRTLFVGNNLLGSIGRFSINALFNGALLPAGATTTPRTLDLDMEVGFEGYLGRKSLGAADITVKGDKWKMEVDD